MSDTGRQGRVHVICGPMFAGKTARLIERLHAAQQQGRPVVAFKHADDVRYSPGALATHDRRRFAAVPVRDVETIRQRVGSAEVVAIDEGQFFGPALVELCRELRAAGRTVIVAGIDYNAWGQPFEPMPQLKAVADEVEVLTIPCTVCGRPARFSQRMSPPEGRDMVGGPGQYEPRCERCFEPLDARRYPPR